MWYCFVFFSAYSCFNPLIALIFFLFTTYLLFSNGSTTIKLHKIDTLFSDIIYVAHSINKTKRDLGNLLFWLNPGSKFSSIKTMPQWHWCIQIAFKGSMFSVAVIVLTGLIERAMFGNPVLTHHGQHVGRNLQRPGLRPFSHQFLLYICLRDFL